MQSEEVKEKMSTQELAPKKPQMGKSLLIAAIVTWGVSVVGFFIVPIATVEYLFPVAIVVCFLLSCGAAYFYLIEERAPVAARVWGILGALLGCFFSIGAPRAIAIGGGIVGIPLAMAIGGAVLAPKKPKLGGSLMLVSPIGWWFYGIAFVMILGAMDVVFSWDMLIIIMSPFLASSFLISGGILALTSRKGQRASKKMVVIAIAAFFLVPAPIYVPPLFFVLLEFAYRLF